MLFIYYYVVQLKNIWKKKCNFKCVYKILHVVSELNSKKPFLNHFFGYYVT